METQEQIERFRDFLENYKESLHELVARGDQSLIMDFKELLIQDPELADLLLEDPENILKAAELSLDNFDIPTTNMRVRFKNLPVSNLVRIRNIRSIHLDKFISIEGLVRQTSDVRPQVTSAKFECPSCGNTLNILQIDTQFKEPSRCSCGRKGRFRLISKDLIDAQRVVLEEAPESLEGGEQPKRLAIFLKGDLVDPKMEKRSTPGSKVRVSGIVKEVTIPLRTGGQSTRYDLIMESNYIEPIEETFEEIDISKKEEKQILKVSKDPKIYKKITESIAPSIYGHDDVKAALVLQLMGGIQKEHGDGTKIRGDAHVLLIGDPGSGKSQMLQFISRIAPKARLVSGKGASSAGLCVAPNSYILTNPGKIYTAKSLVENKLKNNSKLFQDNIFNAKNPNSKKKIFTLDNNLKIKPAKTSQFWKIKTPEKMVEISTQSGKKLITTPNTKIYSIQQGNPYWKEVKDLDLGEYIATSRKLTFENKNKQLTLSLLKSNPIIYGIKKHIGNMIKIICHKSNLTTRGLAKKLKLNENKLYHHWVNEKARGNINLKDLLDLTKRSRYDLRKVAKDITGFSLYHGHKIRLPTYINEKLLYFTGLMVGDGDLSKSKTTVSIRFSNNSNQLQEEFTNLSKELFGVKTNISSKRDHRRSESRRFASKLVSEILNELGAPLSPKSHRIDLPNTLLSFPHNYVASFLKGYFDADGSPVERKFDGSGYIECSTTSKRFAKKLQLTLLRFGIHSKCLTKDPRPNSRVNSKRKKYVLKMSGKGNLDKFRDNINFNIMDKRLKLERIIGKIKNYNTNIDIIPGSSYLLKKIKKRNKLTYRQIAGYKTSNYFSNRFNISRNNLKKIILRLNNPNMRGFNKLSILANSDVFWEKIIEKKTIKPRYDYIYDLTVEGSHNFLVNGIIVHNTATVVKDEFMRGWALEAGALVLANGGFAIIDEMDKINPEDTSAMHQALEQQVITISKANIQATLKAKTTLLAAANPKLGRFDPYTPIASQIDMPPTLINRFDLIFPIKDLPSKEFDTKVATHVLNLQQKQESIKTVFESDFLKKYISYARQKVKPKLTREAVEEIKNFYVNLRNMPGTGEDTVKPIPISARQLEALVRLSEGSARVRLSKRVTKKDAQRAIETLKRCLMQVGFDYETGQIDIDRISTGIPASQRGKIVKIRELINDLEKKIGKLIPIDDLILEASEQGLDEEAVNEAIEILKRDGSIYQPKTGQISRI